MTVASPSGADWRERAACADNDTRLWFSGQPNTAQEICARCPVPAECLHDALEHETSYSRFGIWGGLTASERNQLPPLPRSKPDAIAALREVLTRYATLERTSQAMTAAPAAPVVDVQLKDSAYVRLKPLTEDSEQLPVGRLLAWGDQHPDKAVQDQAARARAALAGLRTRHTADQELTAITTEAEQLEKRLAELRAREAELAPAKPKKRASTYVRDYDMREVRAWADANGVECSRVGQIPKRVLDAWRARPGGLSA